MIRTAAFILAASGLLNACGGPQAGDRSEARKAVATLTGDDKVVAAGNPQCKMFSPGCQWVATDGRGDVFVTIVPSNYHEQAIARHARHAPNS